MAIDSSKRKQSHVSTVRTKEALSIRTNASKHASADGSGQVPGGGEASEQLRGAPSPTTQPFAINFLPTPTIPSVALATPEQEDAFCLAVIECGSTKAAAESWGLKKAATYWHAANNAEFGAKLDMADACLMRAKVGEVFERNDELLAMEPDAMNKCANAYRVANEQVLRMLGILNRKYSEKSAATQVNIQDNRMIVCTEEQRERLIALNNKILTNGNNNGNHQERLPARAIAE